MKKTSRSILRFVGTLDSVRTTHYMGLQEKDERWWIPSSEDEWNKQMALAAATTLEKVLRGDVICLPRNQFFDSPGWLKIVSYLTQLKLPTFSLCLLNVDPTPRNFLREITEDVLRNPNFALSGWPGLSNKERIKIAENIERKGNFSKMFDGITVDSSLKAFFEAQRDALQAMLAYTSPERRMEYPRLSIIRKVSGSKTSLWDRLCKDFNDKGFRKDLVKKLGSQIAKEYLEHLGYLIEEMPKKARADVLQEQRNALSEDEISKKVNRWLNQRTNLYRAISSFPITMRELLREHINDAYEDSLAESVTGVGRQVSADNGNRGVPYKTRSNHMDVIKEEASEKFVAIPYNTGIDINTMVKIVEAISDERLQKSIENMRIVRETASLSEVKETENSHLELLTEYIPSLIVGQSGKSKLIDFTFNMSGKAIKLVGAATATGIATVLTNFVADPQFEKIFPIILAEKIGEHTAGKIGDKIEIKLRPARDRLKAWLNHKDSKLIAGRVSEWLRSSWENEENL